VPAQQGFWSDEGASETPAREQSCQSRQHRPVRRLQRRSVDLASKDRHLVTQDHDLDGEIGVMAEDESDQLEDAPERPIEEREGHSRMLAAPEPAVKVLVAGHGWHSRHAQVRLRSRPRR
jgi:hypothetical protein